MHNNLSISILKEDAKINAQVTIEHTLNQH
jgi:hypothetical protein